MEEIVLNAALDWLGGQALAGTQTLLSSLFCRNICPCLNPVFALRFIKTPYELFAYQFLLKPCGLNGKCYHP